MCNATDSTFLSTHLNLIGLQCDSTAIYIGFLAVYFGLILGAHKLGTVTHQKHREALSMSKESRDICGLVGLNVAHTFIHIVFVLFISANNIGFVAVSVVAHAIGTVIVYTTQRGDHKHPIRAIANALRHLEDAKKKDVNKPDLADMKKDLTYIVQRFQTLKF